MSEDVTLKPCPFCGGEAWLRQWGSGWALTCRNNRTLARLADFTERECPIAIVLTPTKAEAIATWNTRTGEGECIAQAVAAERARVVGELREKLIRSRELLEMGHEFASEYVTAFSTAIAIAEGES